MHVPAPPREADFFDLGGDSVSVFRVLTQIRIEFGVELSVSEFFRRPELAQLAHAIEQLCAGSACDPPCDLIDPLIAHGSVHTNRRKTSAQLPRPRWLCTFVQRDLLPTDEARVMAEWAHGGGFSVDASLRIEAADRAGCLRLLQYDRRKSPCWIAPGHHSSWTGYVNSNPSASSTTTVVNVLFPYGPTASGIWRCGTRAERAKRSSCASLGTNRFATMGICRSSHSRRAQAPTEAPCHADR